MRAIHTAFAQLTTAFAEASQPSDEKAIKEIINQLPQGFTTLDCLMRDKLCTLVMKTLAAQETVVGETALGLKNAELQQIIERKDVAIEQKDAAIEELRRKLAKATATGVTALNTNQTSGGAIIEPEQSLQWKGQPQITMTREEREQFVVEDLKRTKAKWKGQPQITMTREEREQFVVEDLKRTKAKF